MHIPLWSTLTLVTELGVTASVYFIIWHAYRKGLFLRWFAFGVLAYETLFNITYMTSRVDDVGNAVGFSRFEIALAVFHGVFSILMFAALVAFFIVAALSYKRGENFFRERSRITLAFVLAWGVSILSGITFFISLYIA